MDDVIRSHDEAFRRNILRPLREAFSTLAERHDGESVKALLSLFEAPPRPVDRAAEWLELNISAEVAGTFARTMAEAWHAVKEFHAATLDADLTRFHPNAPQLWPVQQIKADMLDAVDYLIWLELLITPPELSDRETQVLLALHELQAIDAASRRTTAAIVRHVHRCADANSYKAVIVKLVRKGLAKATTGRGGGAWLTPDGASFARRLFAEK